MPRELEKGDDGEYDCNEEKLTDFDAGVEEKECERDVTGGEPWRSPKAQATTQGARAAIPALPSRARMISAATKAIDSAIVASIGGGGTLTKPSAAAASVMLCAAVKAVIATMSWRVLGAIRMRASTKRR